VFSPTNRKKIKLLSRFININMLENQRFDEENLIVGDNTNNGKKNLIEHSNVEEACCAEGESCE
jgi:hypothetical protein